MRLERLHPRPGELDTDTLPELLDLATRAPAGRPYVVLNMVATLDGKATLEGNTRGLGGEADRAVFHALRGSVDAVLVGAGTARTERYGRIVRDETRPTPLAVVVSGRLDLPADLPLLAAGDQEVIVATGSDGDLGGRPENVELWRTADDLPVLLARLREERGVRALLCEGGPTLNGHLFAAGLVDELFLTLSATVTADARAPSIAEGRALVNPPGGELAWLCRSGEDLFMRWRFLRT